jgi:N-acetylmuramoyl-L-alanine amidase
MARIPVSEIPNAPQLPGAPPVAPYGQVPGPRFANQPTTFTPMQGRQPIANFEKYAADLQQKPLPGGFAEGAANVSAAAGRYASVAGEGTARAAQSISNSLNSIGSVFTDIANKANQTRDATDLLRYNDFKEISQAAFENQMLKDKVPVEQWAERWQTEGVDRFMATAQNFGTTPATRAKIQADAAGFAQKQGLHYQNNVLKKSLQDDKDFLTASYEESAKKGDAAGMRDAATELHAQNFENEGQYKLKLGEADRVQHKATIDFVRERNPKELRDQAIAARNGKATGEFKFLNDDPALAAQTSAVAAQEVNTRQAEAVTDFSNRILNRDTRMTDAQIESEGRAAGLDEADIVKLKKQNELEPVWNSQAVAEANDAVAKYDARADVDPKTKLPSIEGYKATLDEINNKVPKEYRKPLLEELNRKRSEYLQGKKQDPMEARRSDYYSDLKKKVDDGLLGETGLDKHGKLKDDPKSIQQNADLFKKKTQIQNDIDALFERSKAERWSVPKFDEEYRKLLAPYMSTQAGQAIYRKAVPELPPVTPEEQKAREAPVAVPVTTPAPITTQGPSGYPASPATTATIAPRTLRETPEFTAAWNKVAKSDQPQQTVTAYVPGMGGTEGGSGVAARAGKANTMEDYVAGKAPYVSVAMDENSEWQGKYLISPSYPGVVFKVEDQGSAFKGKAEQAIDIAFADKSKATNYKESATFAPIDEATAQQMAGMGGEKKVGAITMPAVTIPNMPIQNGIDANAPYMSKPRDVGNITRIIMHGDVKEDANQLVAYGRKVDPDRGFAPGYHFYIARDGTVIQGAPIDRITNHTKGENSDSIGIIIAGADNGKMPTPAQEQAAEMLVSSLGRALGIPNRNVIGHGELQPHRRDRREGGDVAAIIRSRGYLNVPAATI